MRSKYMTSENGLRRPKTKETKALGSESDERIENTKKIEPISHLLKTRRSTHRCAAYHTRPLPAILTVSPTTRTISSHALRTIPLSEPATCSRRRTRSALLAETAAAAVAAVTPIPRSLTEIACRRRRRMRSASETRGTSTNRRKNVTSFGRVRYGVSAPRISA